MIMMGQVDDIELRKMVQDAEDSKKTWSSGRDELRRRVTKALKEKVKDIQDRYDKNKSSLSEEDEIARTAVTIFKRFCNYTFKKSENKKKKTGSVFKIHLFNFSEDLQACFPNDIIIMNSKYPYIPLQIISICW